ncbi:MAG: hypothetical protein AUK35_08740 [Zetaproteobacteria bacterium CG2_30_46_52]|nr:MAG: hypothetical protein AUK35_08740 [Zetaproteobacteria bacterium CG2_30_46_52]
MKETSVLITSDDLLHNIAEGIPVRIFWKDCEGRYLGCNTLFAKDAGLSYAEDIIGKTDFDLGWKNQADLYRSDDALIIQSKEAKLSFEEPQTTPQGHTIWLRTSKVPLYDASNKVIGILGMYEDISAQKNTEKKLTESEERLQQAQTIGNVGVWDWNPSTGDLVWTEETFNIFGYKKGEIKPSYELFLKHVHPDDQDILNNAVGAALHSGAKYDIDCRFSRTDGSFGVANAQGQVSYDKAGQPIRMLGTFQDITERKQIETKLLKSLSLLRATLEATADGILVVDHAGKWETYNQQFIQMWNIPDSILTSGDDKQALDYVLDQLSDPKAFIDKVIELYENPQKISFDILHFKDGRVFERYSKEQRLDEQIIGRVWSFRDITDKHQAEEKLLHSQKMQSIGTLGRWCCP